MRRARDAERASLAAAADEVQKRLDEAKTEILDLGRKIAASGKATSCRPSCRSRPARTRRSPRSSSSCASTSSSRRARAHREPGRCRCGCGLAEATAQRCCWAWAVGLVFGLGMAFLYEYLDNTIKSTEEAEKLFGAPVLGTIPLDTVEKGQKRRVDDRRGLLVRPLPRPTACLRNSLDFINFQHDIKTILVTSAAPGEGKSTVAANLAAALAQAGKKVVLVSVDFRRPTTEQFFNVNNMIGSVRRAARAPTR